ncbi:MAG: enoyl-CoA hydratase/isomerase family protein [Candidatus Dormibacteria bacterium]
MSTSIVRSVLSSSPVPGIQGHCLGAGYQLALACDLRVAAATARLGVPASRFGLLPGPTHHVRMLQQLGPQVTRQLMLSGRSFCGAEALRLGLCDLVCDPGDLDAVVDALLDDILAGAPITVRNSKRMINDILSMTGRGEAMTADRARSLTALSEEAHRSNDLREGLTAFFEHRPPAFRGN